MRRSKGFPFTLLVLTPLLMLVLVTSPTQVAQEMKTLTPIADSYVWNEGPDNNWGREWQLRLEWATIYETLAYLMFDLSEVPSGATIEDAELRLYAIAGDVPALVSVYYCPSNNWTEDGITYNSKPSFSPSPIDTANITAPSWPPGWYSWNVTDTSQSKLGTVDKRLSFVVKAYTYRSVAFYSRDAQDALASLHPQLDLRYWPPQPSGGNSVQAPLEGKILNPIADSDVFEKFPDWNHGRNMTLSVNGKGSHEILSFLMFDLSQVPSGATIEWAMLRLYAKGVFIKALVSVYYCPSNDWTEGGITYNNKPAFSPNSTDIANVTKPGWYEWNVTGNFQSAFETADKKLSLVLKADTYGSLAFDSKDNPWTNPYYETRPRLLVSYLAPPPSGNNSILTAAIVIMVIVASATVLALTYILLKRRKRKVQMQRKT
jgi:hypothetical protein